MQLWGSQPGVADHSWSGSALVRVRPRPAPPRPELDYRVDAWYKSW